MKLPDLLFGTAWKEDRTEALTTQALVLGYRAVDTANQRKHYYEEGVGRAVHAALSEARIPRSELFLQTKFTYERGQDHRLPYDPKAAVADQVRQSFASSLEHLGVDYLDSYVLHGPETGGSLTANDKSVWRTMEELHGARKAHSLGISNISTAQLTTLLDFAKVKPAFVQNRCYPSTAWDRETRALCRKHGITYQGFSLIRDPVVMQNSEVAAIARRHGRTVAQVVYRWAKQVGMWPMIGSTSEAHLREASAIGDFELNPQEVAVVEQLG